MKTIAQQIKWDFEVNGSLEIKNKNGNRIYWENSNRDWLKWEQDSKGNTIYFESSSGFWEKMEYDSEGNPTYYENSYGRIIDEQPTQLFSFTCSTSIRHLSTLPSISLHPFIYYIRAF